MFWFIVGVVVGALGALTLEHGWGWVLAKYHAWRGK